MRRDRRKFTPEFKAEVVRLVIDGGRSISEVAKSSDLSLSVVGKWVQKANAQGSPTGTHSDSGNAEDKLRALEKKHRELPKEHEFLKKQRSGLQTLKDRV